MNTSKLRPALSTALSRSLNVTALHAAVLTAAVGLMLNSPLSHAQAVDASVLAEVKARGTLRCGVNADLKGFSQTNSLGEYSGLDIDVCRAVAAAVFNDPDAVEYLPASAQDRFSRLSAGEFDLLARNTTWTLSRNTQFGEFVGVNYYDGQGFMVPRRSGIRSALELDNITICVSSGTTTELNAIDFFKVSGMRYKPFYHDTGTQSLIDYDSNKCGALTTDRSGLAALRATLDEPLAHRILPEVISKEPLGPMVRSGDAAWANVARWTLNCMVNAEELGVTSSNVDSPSIARNPAVARLVGSEGDAGEQLGLDAQWCANVIRHVGNYGESYERHVGPNTELGLDRGVNALWTDGGLLYAPPIR